MPNFGTPVELDTGWNNFSPVSEYHWHQILDF